MIDYTGYLDGDVWPSFSRSEGLPVEEMNPKHAENAHGVLMRWAVTEFYKSLPEYRIAAMIALYQDHHALSEKHWVNPRTAVAYWISQQPLARRLSEVFSSPAVKEPEEAKPIRIGEQVPRNEFIRHLLNRILLDADVEDTPGDIYAGLTSMLDHIEELGWKVVYV